MTSLARLKASVLNNLAKGLSGEQGKGVGGGLEKGEAALVSPHVDNNLTITSSTTRHLCCPYRSVVHLPSLLVLPPCRPSSKHIHCLATKEGSQQSSPSVLGELGPGQLGPGQLGPG